MPQTIHRGIKALIDEANAEIETLSAADAIKAAQSDDVVIVDIRDPREIERDGRDSRRILLHPRHAGILDRSGEPLCQADLPAGQEIHLSLRRRHALGAGGENRAGHGAEAGRAYGRRLCRLARRRRRRSRRSSRRSRRVESRHPARASAANPESRSIQCTLDCRDRASATTPGMTTKEICAMTLHRRSACLHRLARRPYRRSQGQDHRRVLQAAGRAAAAGGRLSRPRIFRARCFSTSTPSPITTIRGRICIRTPTQFARDVAALGISTGDTVVAYDSGGWVAAPRAWWMFLSFGHRNVKVLDGGLKKWLREGRPTHSGKVTAKPGKFQAKFDPSYVRSQQQLVGNLDNARRASGRCAPAAAFRGHRRRAAAGLRARPHPGQPQRALCRAVRRRDRRDEAAGRIAEGLSRAPASTSTKPIVTSCGSGVSALVLTLALYRLGVRGSALYDGSWAEWGLPDGPPVATGPA